MTSPRRAKLLPIDTPYETISKELQTQALPLVQELDGLPLAIYQAGAYIEETKFGLAGYCELYKKDGIALLQERGIFPSGHPDPVATTWVLSFQKIEQANPAAAELQTFCAFLHPDAIPEELITEGASELGPVLGPVAGNPISFNKAIGEILKFSLIHRDMNNKTLDIHRLVQSVILKSLNDKTQHQWIERLVRAMNRVFPDVKFENWPQCDRLLSQAQQCAFLIPRENHTLAEGARILNETALYLQERARYSEAMTLYQRALSIREQVLEPTHLDVAESLNNLGGLYDDQGKYAEAEPLFQRALAIWEQALGPTHPAFATSLNNLALLYNNQGKYAEAEPLYLRALSIREQALGPIHPHIANSLNNLGTLYRHQKKHAEAEPLYQRTLAIVEQALGPTHPDVATSLNNLASLLKNQGKYAEAAPLFQRALNIFEEALGLEHPHTQTVRENYEDLLKKIEGEKD